MVYNDVYNSIFNLKTIITTTMSSVISIRVPPDIKQEMEKMKTEINWNEEIKGFLKNKIDERKKKELLDNLIDKRQKGRELPEGTAAKMVREDRDSH
jgi:hypothetical protein